MRTSNDYTIIYDHRDGYYHYAVLDENGEYTPHSAKVGIDNPPVYVARAV